MDITIKMMKITMLAKVIFCPLLAAMITLVILFLSVPLNMVTDDQTLCEINHDQRNIVIFVLGFVIMASIPVFLFYRKEICNYFRKKEVSKYGM